MTTIETDYLVIGAGALGMAFVDALMDAAETDVVLVDRRHQPGGHWNDAYPFVRLHQPSACYGLNSMPHSGRYGPGCRLVCGQDLRPFLSTRRKPWESLRGRPQETFGSGACLCKWTQWPRKRGCGV